MEAVLRNCQNCIIWLHEQITQFVNTVICICDLWLNLEFRKTFPKIKQKVVFAIYCIIFWISITDNLRASLIDLASGITDYFFCETAVVEVTAVFLLWKRQQFFLVKRKE